jgi:heat shock protein HtpX
MPKLKVMDSPALNAFASGMNEKQYAVTVTTGLLESLDDAEIEAVLGHELTHIRNGDVRLLVVAVIIAGVISFFAEMFIRLFFNFGGGLRSRSSDSDRGKGGAAFAIMIAIALVAVAWFLSVVIRFALSRKREFLADAGAVELTKNPDAMISALRKIENRGELEGATSAVMEMCVDNPREGFQDIFATHPSVESRVDALVRYAGGHDPGPLAVPQFDSTEEAGQAEDDYQQAPPQPAEPPKSFLPPNVDVTKPFLPPPGGEPPKSFLPPGADVAKPFLPPNVPIELGVPSGSAQRPGPAAPESGPGPWGPHGRS